MLFKKLSKRLKKLEEEYVCLNNELANMKTTFYLEKIKEIYEKIEKEFNIIITTKSNFIGTPSLITYCIYVNINNNKIKINVPTDLEERYDFITTEEFKQRIVGIVYTNRNVSGICISNYKLNKEEE